MPHTSTIESPFSAADYLQLASLGKHSVQLELTRDDEPLGVIVVRDGQAWSADDAFGSGFAAFTRLVTVEHISVLCVPPASTPRNLEGPCEQLLLDAMRVHDEQRIARPIVAEGSAPTGPIRAAVRAALLPPRAEPLGFEQLYDEGIDALIEKRYTEAFDRLSRARAIKTTPTIEANLKRLKTLGYV